MAMESRFMNAGIDAECLEACVLIVGLRITQLSTVVRKLL
jgi:hypothetical protein